MTHDVSLGQKDSFETCAAAAAAGNSPSSASCGLDRLSGSYLCIREDICCFVCQPSILPFLPVEDVPSLREGLDCASSVVVLSGTCTPPPPTPPFFVGVLIPHPHFCLSLNLICWSNCRRAVSAFPQHTSYL